MVTLSEITAHNVKNMNLIKFQNEAARITSGATKLVPLTNLYKEIGWESLSKRQKQL